ncbi:MAG: hypothetical protein ACRDE5_03315, partial [Ginsengibacter sp.]
AQTNYYQKSQIKKDLVIYACQFIAGSADGVNQALVHHDVGMGNSFWDIQTSWKNKYRNFDKGDTRPAFFGSKSILVCATDGYHLTRAIDRSFSLCSLGFALSEKNNLKQIIKKVIISSLLNRAGFLLFFNVIYPRRD